MIAARPLPDTPGLFELRCVSFNSGIAWQCIDDELPYPGLVPVPDDIVSDVQAVGAGTTEEGQPLLMGRIVFDPMHKLPILGGQA